MQPLEGTTVIEFSTMITASFAAMMMAEQGAKVIKVESVNVGDPMRYLGTSKGGISALFANCNRGKSSMALDLKQRAGQEIVKSMVSTADVVIHNYRPGVMEKLNLGSKSLRSENPRLIYTAISGFGTLGPLNNAPAYDPVVQAHAGFAVMQGTDGPEFIRSLICDKITAYTTCQAVTAALLVREKTNKGQHIDISMLDSGLFFLFPDGFMNHTLLDDDVEVGKHLADVMYNLTETQDGGIIISAATEQHISGALQVAGRDDLIGDPRFTTVVTLIENIEEFMEMTKEGFSNMTSEEAIQKLQENDVPCAECHNHEEVINQPQIDASDTVLVRDHPLMGSMRVVKSPSRFSGEQSEPGNHCPAHGENTESLLKERGYTEEQIAEFRQNNVIS
jgi:crotonobetainyl-CoA:carnitine CoA-transferase CaiB-like acyl-CoA transferase